MSSVTDPMALITSILSVAAAMARERARRKSPTSTAVAFQ